MDDPGIYQLKDALIAPDAGHDLFVHLYQMGIPDQAGLKVHGCPVELTVLGPSALGISHGLVNGLGVRPVLAARGIVAFVNKVAGLGIDLIPVRGALSDGHKENRGSATRCVIHPFLELLAFLSDDLGVGDNVVRFQRVFKKLATAFPPRLFVVREEPRVSPFP